MKRLIATLTFLACCTYGTAVFADWDNGGISDAQIETIVVKQDGEFYIRFDKDICDGGGVVNKVGYVYRDLKPNDVNWSQEGAEMMLRLALAAKLSGKSVKVYADHSGTRWGCRMGALTLHW